MKHIAFSDKDSDRLARSVEAGGSVTWLGPNYEDDPNDYTEFVVAEDLSLCRRVDDDGAAIGTIRPIHSLWPHGLSEHG